MDNMPYGGFPSQHGGPTYPGGSPPYGTGGAFGGSPYMDPRIREKRVIRKTATGLGVSFLGYYLLSAMAIGFAAIFFAASGFLPEFAGELGQQILNTFVYVVVLVVPFAVYGCVLGAPRRVFLPRRRVSLGVMLSAVFITLGVSVISMFAINIITAVLKQFGIEVPVPQFDVPSSPPALAVFLVNMTILPAICEEIVFRGIILGSLRRFGDTFALICSSVIFGLFHTNPLQALNAGIIGFFLGYFVIVTGSLKVSMLIHLINNAIWTLLTVFSQYVPQSTTTAANMILMGILLLAGIISAVASHRSFPSVSGGFGTRTYNSTARNVAYFFTNWLIVANIIISAIAMALVANI